MHKRYLFGWYRLIFSLLGFAAISVQLINGLNRPTFSIINFFSFFTIESNILAACLLLVTGLLTLHGKPSERLVLWRGAATLYMATTGIIYVLLLSGLEESLQTPIPWINLVLHYIMPVVLLLDWTLNLPRKAISFKRATVWLLFPFAYLVYSLVRGSITNWYPYPFLNPEGHGYIGIALISIVITAALLGLVWLLTILSRIKYLKK